MQDQQRQRPLSSDELARDAEQDARASLKPEDASGHTLPASEAAADPTEERGPSPAAGTMLPPD
jgi:hypothetical protein